MKSMEDTLGKFSSQNNDDRIQICTGTVLESKENVRNEFCPFIKGPDGVDQMKRLEGRRRSCQFSYTFLTKLSRENVRMMGGEFHYSILTKPVSTGTQHYGTVLWIRIRNNPNFLAGSEYESEKSSDLDSDPDIVVKYKNFEKSQIEHLKENKTTYVFQLENFFLWRTDSRTHMNSMRGTI
jgi:hypothetical protein